MISNKNKTFLQILKDISEVSERLDAKIYIWGGFVIDLIEGKFVREHDDLDGFILNMDSILNELISEFEKREYTVKYNEKFRILAIYKGDLHAAFNILYENKGIAEWQHIGENGSVYFPYEWLDQKPRIFYEIEIYTSNIQFEYCFRNIAPLVNPEWSKRRVKDIKAIKYYTEKLCSEDINIMQIEGEIWSYNPFWIDFGHNPFKPPVLVVPKYEEI